MDESSQLEADVTPVLGHLGRGAVEDGGGVMVGLEQGGGHRRDGRRRPGGVERHLDRRALARGEATRQARGQQGLEQLEPPAASVSLGAIGEVERVEPQMPTRRQGQGGRSHRGGQRRILPFGIEHERPTTEGQLAQQIGLDQRALAPTDLTEDHGIGIRQRPGGIEREGVIGEQPPEQVGADHHPGHAVADVMEQRVERTEVPGGRLVASRGGRRARITPPHVSPPPSGRVATRPRP